MFRNRFNLMDMLIAAVTAGLLCGLIGRAKGAEWPTSPHWPAVQTWPVTKSDRAPQWEALSRKFRAAHPTCAACGESPVVAHHVIPVHVRHDLELDEDNLIALCAKHHFELGHKKNWQDWNPKVREDAAKLLAKNAKPTARSGHWEPAGLFGRQRVWVEDQEPGTVVRPKVEAGNCPGGTCKPYWK